MSTNSENHKTYIKRKRDRKAMYTINIRESIRKTGKIKSKQYFKLEMKGQGIN
jgi:hypothetical protein